jgi:hypothetical protein
MCTAARPPFLNVKLLPMKRRLDCPSAVAASALGNAFVAVYIKSIQKCHCAAASLVI